MRRPHRLLAPVLLLALVLPSCSGGSGSTPTPSPSATSPSPTPTGTAPSGVVAVEVFFMNTDLGDPCAEVFPVARQVSSVEPLRGAVAALLAGPTTAERADGYEGWFSEATADLLVGVRLDGSRALISLRSSLPSVIPNASSSCGSIGLLAQLDRTATQFPEVDEAWYSLEGDRAAFYGWLQLAAPDDPGPLPPPGPTTSPTPTTPPRPGPTPEPDDPTAARAVPPDLVGTEWSTVPVTDRVVALTFDAGANGDGIPSILATLEASGTPATFFLTGRWVTAYPSYATAIGARFPVGNHTQSHPDLATLDGDAVRAEVTAAHEAVLAATGRDPRPWFRFPYGARRDATIAVVNDLGYGSVRWTTDTLGWQGTAGGRTAATVVERVLADLRPGQIVLLHVGSHPADGSTLDADALPEVIRRVHDAGYAFIDLDHLLTGA